MGLVGTDESTTWAACCARSLRRLSFGIYFCKPSIALSKSRASLSVAGSCQVVQHDWGEELFAGDAVHQHRASRELRTFGPVLGVTMLTHFAESRKAMHAS